MKIEMGESLFYSWMRHIRECQVVQTNWKTSPSWKAGHGAEIEECVRKVSEHFLTGYGYDLFGKSRSVKQILRQSEADVIGIRLVGQERKIHTAEVAFHENGLDYGSRPVTVTKVLAKLMRTAMCVYAFLDSKEAEILFASPKIHKAVMNDLKPRVEELNLLLAECGFSFTARILANDDFRAEVLEPILKLSGDVADTSELFLRSYQMYRLFSAKMSPGG